jgi:hypothetical protein
LQTGQGPGTSILAKHRPHCRGWRAGTRAGRDLAGTRTGTTSGSRVTSASHCSEHHGRGLAASAVM